MKKIFIAIFLVIVVILGAGYYVVSSPYRLQKVENYFVRQTQMQDLLLKESEVIKSKLGADGVMMALIDADTKKIFASAQTADLEDKQGFCAIPHKIPDSYTFFFQNSKKAKKVHDILVKNVKEKLNLKKMPKRILIGGKINLSQNISYFGFIQGTHNYIISIVAINPKREHIKDFSKVISPQLQNIVQKMVTLFCL